MNAKPRRVAGAVFGLVLLAVVASVIQAQPRSGTTITVTTVSNAQNGNVSSAAALAASPGPDGISLREAIEATNNDPGTYTVRFAPGLRGATIKVMGGTLPFLTGGGVSIDGDISGDGRPDVTLRKGRGAGGPALTISSGGNTLHALRLQGFSVGVSFSLVRVGGKLPTGQTFAGNTVQGLTIRGGDTGIFFGPNGAECEPRGRACATHNRWRELRITGNTIAGRLGGQIGVLLFGSVGDSLEGVTITDNNITVPRRHSCLGGPLAGNTIDVTAGAGLTGDRQNRISDVLIARNSIRGGALQGINVIAGHDGADANVVEGLRVLDNRVRLQPAKTNKCEAQQIHVSTGDYSGSSRGTHADDNLMRNIEISGNSLTGNEGIRVFAGGASAARNQIRNVRIARNAISVIGPFPGVDVRGSEGGIRGATRSSRVSDVVVDANRITITKADPEELRPAFGGITVMGGDASGVGPVTAARVKRVRITNNVVRTRMVGISLVGGFAYPEGPEAKGVRRSSVMNVAVSKNRIPEAPMRTPSYEEGARGIRIAGGIGSAHRNRVSCVRIRGNRVAGANGVSIVANARPRAAPGASRNRASRAC
jgi:hypothetical protein